MISLILHNFKAKGRIGVNIRDITQMDLGYNWLVTQKTLPITASFVKDQ